MKKSELKNIIKEEVESLFKSTGRLTPYLSIEDFNKKWNINESNDYPQKNSKWYNFAVAFDIGVLDLDNFADLIGHNDFNNLDKLASPKQIFKSDPKIFVRALKHSSLKAEDMSDNDIVKTIKGLK